MMNFIQSIRKVFRADPVPVAKASRATGVDFFENPWGQPAQFDRATLKNLIQESPWVYRCIQVKQSAIMQTPFLLKSGRESDAPVIENARDVMDFLNQPNPFMSYQDFINAIVSSLELTGDAYLEWVIEAGKPEAWVLATDQINPIPSKRNMVSGYRYLGLNGQAITFLPDELLRITYYNPTDPLHGLPPVKAAERDLISEYFSGNYNNNFFKNGAVLRGILEAPGHVTDEEAERFRSKWRSQYNGDDNAHKIAILMGGWKYNPIGVNPKDMEFLLLRKWAREAILAAMGVPPVLVGVFEYANYANSKEQIKIFWQNTAIPQMKKLEHGISMLLQKLFKREIYFCFDTTEIEALQEEQTAIVNQAIAKVGAGIIDRDEARVESGYAPTNDLSMKIRTVSGSAIPVAESVMGMEPTEDTDEEGNQQAAAPSNESPSLAASRISLALQRLVDAGDEAGANRLREEMFRLLGIKQPKGGVEASGDVAAIKGAGYDALFNFSE